MLQQTRFIQEKTCLTDRFDNPFVDELFMRAGEGRISASGLNVVQSGGYRFPYENLKGASTLSVRAARFWAHGYGPVGGAFWDPDGYHLRNEADFHAGLDKLAEASDAQVLIWPYFPMQAREYGWLENWVSARLGRDTAKGLIPRTRDHARAFLNCESSAVSEDDGGLQLSRNKRKTTGRQWRRLEELGNLQFESTRDGLDHAEAIEAFLRVEASGWKANRGTALAVNAELNAFAHAFLPGMLANERAQIDLLVLNGRCLSGLVSFHCGRGLFTWKTGMDDVYKRYSPGVQILLEVSRQAVADPGVDYIDSLADSGHPVAEHIWAGRRQLATLFVPLTGFGQVAAHGLCSAYSTRDTARYWAKRALGRV